jgi:integrase
MNKPQTLTDALKLAESHWAGRPGARKMSVFAWRCIEPIGEATKLATLSKSDAVAVLAHLRKTLAPKSVAVYYGAFRRMLGLAGVSCAGWPAAPTPPRKARDPFEGEDLAKVVLWLVNRGWVDTADLVRLLKGTGARIDIEALREGGIAVISEADEYTLIRITGKGGHERTIPVVDIEARTILGDPERLSRMRAIVYDTHRKRFQQAVSAAGVTSLKATPHAIRHGYATDALRRSNGNLRIVQDLLGHASPKTTATYTAVNMDDKLSALAVDFSAKVPQ